MIEPMSETKLWDLINEAEAQMTRAQERLWDAIRILPERWRQHPYGDDSGGFWAVGLLGRRVLSFNEIEHGFNISRYSPYGTIDHYLCNQDRLELAIQELEDLVLRGYAPGPAMGGPKPGTYQEADASRRK